MNVGFCGNLLGNSISARIRADLIITIRTRILTVDAAIAMRRWQLVSSMYLPAQAIDKWKNRCKPGSCCTIAV
jgi:hypothetical protein